MSHFESPLLCVDPREGDAFLIHWWTDCDRGKLVVLRSWDATDRVLRRLVHEHPSLVVKNACRIRFASPSRTMEQEAAWWAKREALREFLLTLGCACESATRLGLPVPEFCKPCEDSRAMSRDDHFSCRKCYSGFVVDGAGAIYEKKGAAFMAAMGYPPEEQKGRVKSRAAPLVDGSIYYTAEDASGNHSDGVRINVREAPEKARRPSKHQYPLEYQSSVFFRYLLVEDLNLGWLPDLQAKERAAFQRAREEEHESRRRSTDEKERQRVAAAFAALK